MPIAADDGAVILVTVLFVAIVVLSGGTKVLVAKVQLRLLHKRPGLMVCHADVPVFSKRFQKAVNDGGRGSKMKRNIGPVSSGERWWVEDFGAANARANSWNLNVGRSEAAWPTDHTEGEKSSCLCSGHMKSMHSLLLGVSRCINDHKQFLLNATGIHGILQDARNEMYQAVRLSMSSSNFKTDSTGPMEIHISWLAAVVFVGDLGKIYFDRFL